MLGAYLFLHLVGCSNLYYRYKYVPSMLKDVLFPVGSSPIDTASSRKRRHAQESEDVEMMDVETLITTSSVRSQRDLSRPVILETAKESYLLSPSILTAESAIPVERMYELALILETEVVVEDDPTIAESTDKPAEATESATDSVMQPDDASEAAVKDDQATPEAGKDAIATEPETRPADAEPSAPSLESAVKASLSAPISPATATAPSRMATPPPRSISPSRPSPVHSPEPDKDALPSSPMYGYRRRSLSAEDEVETDKIALLPTQVLQRNMTEGMFRFTDEGVYVLDGSASDGMETEWVIQVKNWKWAPVVRGRERAVVNQ